MDMTQFARGKTASGFFCEKPCVMVASNLSFIFEPGRFFFGDDRVIEFNGDKTSFLAVPAQSAAHLPKSLLDSLGVGERIKVFVGADIERVIGDGRSGGDAFAECGVCRHDFRLIGTGF